MKKVIRLIFLASITLSFAFAKGEVTKVYAHYEDATASQYKAKKNKNSNRKTTYKWGRGKNLVIDGFEYRGTRYQYQTMADKVQIIRHDNQNATGNPCGLFVEKVRRNAKYTYKPSYPSDCDMAKVMGGRVINVGALDLFRNSGSTAKNIERVDFIFSRGIKAPANATDLEKAGHVVTEKSGNNPIKIAAILSLDANGKPASYGPLVGVHTQDDIDYGITEIYVTNTDDIIGLQHLAFVVNEKKGKQGKPWYLTKSYEPMGMAFVSLKDLGIKAGQTYYGFSYFGEDVTNNYDLTKPETFPVDHLHDTADPYGGVAGYFQDESLSLPVVSVTDVNQSEGNSGKTDFAFKISLSQPASEGMSFWYTVTDGSDGDETEYQGAYLDDQDMEGGSGCIEVVKSNSTSKSFDVYGSHDEACQEIPAGVTSITIHTNVNGDNKVEPDERFFLDLYAPEKLEWSDTCVRTDEDGNKQCRANGIIINDDIASSDENNTGTCYAMSDDGSKIYRVSMQPGLTPLSSPVGINIENSFNGEGSAYRGIDKKLYAFRSRGDTQGPSHMYQIDVADGTIEPVKQNLLEGPVDGAEFYYDKRLKKEILYIISGEDRSKLYAFDSMNWQLIDGYPKSIHGDTTEISSIAIDPNTGDAYGMDDYDYDRKKPKLYQIDLATGYATFKVQLKKIADAEGLAYASDGNLYIEDEGNIDGRKIYKVDLQTGALTPAAKLGGSGDIEGLSCNGTEIVENPVLLRAQYRFDACSWDGTEGEIADSSGKNNGAYQTTKTVRSKEGVVQRAAYFDGSDTVMIEPTFALGSEPFSILLWIKPDTLPQKDYMALFSKELEVYLKKDGKISINMKNGTIDLVSDTAIDPAQWTHLALVSNGTKLTLYINGIAHGSANIGPVAIGKNGANTLFIGKTGWNQAEKYKGLVDEMKFYFGALKETELSTIYNNEKAHSNYDGSTREEVVCAQFQPLTCSEKAIVIDYDKTKTAPGEQVQTVQEIDLVTGEVITQQMFSDALDNAYVNGLGFNPKDRYLWGSDIRHPGYLVKVGLDESGKYVQQSLGPIDGLGDKSSFAGDFDDDGFLYMYRQDKTMYKIDVDSLKVVKTYDFSRRIFNKRGSKINKNAVKVIADIAYNPKDKNFYGIDKLNNFYRISVTSNKMVRLGSDVIPYGKGIYGTAFFDNAGNFYAIKTESDNGSVNKSVRITINGNRINAVPFSNVDINQNKNDGARCTRAPVKIDFADAPDSYGSSLASDGARHKLPAFGNAKLYIGEGVSAESDAKLIDSDDDTALTFTPLYANDSSYSVQVPVHNALAYSVHLGGWIDFNRNGIFENNEGVVISVVPGDHIATLQWTVPSDVKAGETYLRLRLTSDDLTVANMTGVKKDGEVEDHKFTIYARSAYDAWDAMIQNSPHLQTQVVGKPFTPTLAKVEGDLNDTDMKVGVVDAAVCENLESADLSGVELKPFTLTQEQNGNTFFHFMSGMMSQFLDGFVTRDNPLLVPNPPTFTIDKAMKKARLLFVWKKNGEERRACSSDSFAVRPDRFVVESEHTTVKAGELFTLKIKAVDYTTNHNPVEGYNEILVLNGDGNGSVSLDYNETKQACSSAALQIVGNNRQFQNGVLELTMKYPDVGELNISIAEIMGREFAQVDRNDSNTNISITAVKNRRYTFDPAKLTFDWESINGDGSRYTYYNTLDTSINHNDPMAAKLIFEAEVHNADGQPLNNFTPECYAKDIDITLDASIVSDQPQTYKIRARYPDNNASVAFSQMPEMLSSQNAGLSSLKVDKSLFKAGKARKTIEFNIERDASYAMNPMIYTFRSATAQLEDLNQTVPSDDANLTFVYVRAHIPDQKIVGKEGDAAIFYEVYCKDCNMTRYGLNGLSESVDSIYWYQWPGISEMAKVFDNHFGSYNQIFANPADVIAKRTGAITGISQNIAQNKLHIKVSKAPFKTRVTYKPKKYLIYNPFRANATTESFITEFLPEKSKWAGKGNTGHTIDANIAPRNNVDVIDW